MKNTLRALIESDCAKHIRRYHLRLAIDRKNGLRFKKRTGLEPTSKPIREPAHWEIEKTFNPFYVRAHAECLSFTIANKIRSGTYAPKPSLEFGIPKPGGGERKLSIFTIPDAVVAKYLNSVLLRRNFATFSSYAFAYRPDRNVHNAIEHLFESSCEIPRKYVLEYDFAKYFDSISHDYLVGLLKSKLKISARELRVVSQFLKHQKASGIDSYKRELFVTNQVGVPQGNTLSLLLANLACVELDRRIERQGASFARYCDDSIILCDSYDQAHKCANHMLSHGSASGIKVNLKKSEGISLFGEDKHAEIKNKESFEFCGHKVSGKEIVLRDSSVRKIKSKISAIINWHLIHYPKRHGISDKRYDPSTQTDWDLVTCINEIRRYIYGNISEKEMSKGISDKTSFLQFSHSVTSFYPLVTEGYIFRALDGWLVDTLRRALRIRIKLLISAFPSYVLPPTKLDLISGGWYRADLNVETKSPSFHKSWIYTRKLVRIYGVGNFPNPQYY